MKQQFVITHPHTFLQEMEITWQFINRPTLKYGVFLQKYKDNKYFCGHSILTEGVFVTQMSQFDELGGLQQVAVSWASDDLV